MLGRRRLVGCTALSLVVLLLGALPLAGCSPAQRGKLWPFEVGPDYVRPSAKVPDAFRGAIRPAEAASFADLPWWKVFNDPALQGLIREALSTNYDLQTAVARVDQSRALLGVAASPLYPQVGYQAGAEREKTFVPLGSGRNVTYNAFSGLLDVAWEVDVWGRIRRATEAARAAYLANEDARRGVVLTLVSQIATDYFRLLELDEELAIARDSSQAYAKALALFRESYRHGTDTEISSSRAAAALEASHAAIATIQLQIVEQEDAIAVLLGATPHAIERGAALAKQPMPQTPPGLTTAVLERRPDILAAEQDMVAANAQIGEAVASFFPTIGLSALYGRESRNIDDVVKNSFSIWNVVGQVGGPIFQGGRLIETYRAQQAFWDETIAQYRQTVVEAFREVSDAMAAETQLAAEHDALEKQVAALKRAVKLSELRYNTGYAFYFEVLDALQQLYPAEDALAQVERDQWLAVITLYKALGGGWNTDPAGSAYAAGH